MPEITVNKAIVDLLVEAGIDHAFGMPGGTTDFLWEEIYLRRQEIKCIITRHEAAAACMADMYGRLARKPGVLVGQGPFIGTNGSFGIAEAMYAGSPMLVLAELSDWYGVNHQAPYQVATGAYGSINLPDIMRSMTKYTAVADTPGEVPYCIELAIKHAISGRPGPAAVLMRWNTLGGRVDLAKVTPKLYPLEGFLRVSPPSISQPDAVKIAEMLLAAEKPVMITGRGIHAANAYDELRRLAELVGMPVATTYMGKGDIPETHDLALGSLGTLGQKLANQHVGAADVILAIGTCLAPENTDNLNPKLIDPDRQKLIHVDIDPRNAGWTLPVTIGVTSDARLALQEITKAIQRMKLPFDARERVAALVKQKKDPASDFFQSPYFAKDSTPINPERVVKVVNETIGDNLLVLESGNARAWFTKLFQTRRPGQIVAGGGMGGMGWGVQGALAAQMLLPDQRVFALMGDGAMMMALHALNMAKQFSLPIIYLVMNNECMGNIRDYLRPKCRPYAETPRVDFAATARALGIEGLRADTAGELRNAIESALASQHACLVDINTSQATHMRIRS
nr:thiamine pyrophosphate-binding protein [Candidatus Sigynarchaeum springense]